MSGRTVITFGTFDVFHVGHIRVLQRAAALGDRLVVGVSADALNIAKKGRAPVYTQDERMEIVASLRVVDEVFVEESLELKRDYIVEHDADVLVMGDDWAGKFDWVVRRLRGRLPAAHPLGVDHRHHRAHRQPGVVRARLLPALAVGAALWVVAVSAVAAGLSALGWWSPWLAWPVAVGRGRRVLVVRAPAPAGADAGRGVGRARRRGRGLHGVGGGDALRAGAAPARRREQPAGRGEPGDDARRGWCRSTPSRSAGPAVLDLPGVTLASPAFFEAGSSASPGGAAAVRRRRRRWSTPSGGGPGEPGWRCCCPRWPWAWRCSRWGCWSRGWRARGRGSRRRPSPASSSRCCTPRGRPTPSRWPC